MRRLLLPLIALLGVAVLPAYALSAPPLVEHWAPILYHDVEANVLATPRDDYLTRFDFDGDWDAENNRANMESGAFPLTASVYWSVIESETHWYITYTFFHPYDSSVLNPTKPESEQQGLCIQHENDIEGVTLTIRKDGSAFGEFRCAATEAHGDVWYFKEPGSDVQIGSAYRDPVVGGNTGPDSTAYFPDGDDRLAVFIEANGHGVGSVNRAMTPSGSGFVSFGGQLFDFPGGDGIVYVWDSGPAEEPDGSARDTIRYELRDLDELWQRRFNTGGEAPYCQFQNFVGSRGCQLDNLSVSFLGACTIGGCAANPPWGWDSDASGSPVGEWFLDPAYAAGFLHLAHLPERNDPGFLDYVSNTYLQSETSLDVTSPTAPEEWTEGETRVISWNSFDLGQGPNLADSVRIELSRDGGAWETIAASVPLLGGSWQWNVAGPATDEARIRVLSATDCVLTARSVSAPFRILPSSVNVADRPRAGDFLFPAAPNPFYSSTAIAFQLAESAPVRLTVYDAGGRAVAHLMESVTKPAGENRLVWRGTDDAGRPLPSGTYFLQLETGRSIRVEKLVLSR